MPLDTLENVKSDLLVTGADDDALLTRLMAAAECYITQHCRRIFAGGAFTETHPGGGSLLFLQNFPITAVTSLRVDAQRQFGAETERDPASFVVHAERGVVESLTGSFLPPRKGRAASDWPGTVRVGYSTPTGTVPISVCNAFSQLVGHWYRQAKTNAGVNYQMLTDWSDGTTVKSFSWGLAAGLKVPALVHELLAPYRVPTV